MVKVGTFQRNLAGIDHFLDTKIRPEGTRADCPEIYVRNPHFFNHRNSETQHPIHYQATHAPPSAAIAQPTSRLHQLAELRPTNFLEAQDDIQDALARSRVVVGEAVGDGLDLEAGVAGEAGVEACVAEEAVVGVVGE